MNKYEARWNNAVKIAEYINSYIDQGYLVFDADNNIITQKFRITDKGIDLPDSEVKYNYVTGYFIKDMELDNGYHTTTKEYMKMFKGWKMVHPKNFIAIDFK